VRAQIAIATAEQASIWAAVIVGVCGILAAVITVAGGMFKDSLAFQRDLVKRLLDREEEVLTPLVSSGENQQDAIKTIGAGVAELLLAQKIADGQRRREGGA
jgi:hypothetical protein